MLCFEPRLSSHRTVSWWSADNDSLLRYHQWHANLRNLDIEPIKSVAYNPTSHPIAKRLIGTVRDDVVCRSGWRHPQSIIHNDNQ